MHALDIALLWIPGEWHYNQFSGGGKCKGGKGKCTAIDNITYNVYGIPYMKGIKTFLSGQMGGRKMLDSLDTGDHKIVMVNFAQFFSPSPLVVSVTSLTCWWKGQWRVCTSVYALDCGFTVAFIVASDSVLGCRCSLWQR